MQGKTFTRPPKKQAPFVHSVAQVVASANSLAPGPDHNWFEYDPVAKAAVHVSSGRYDPASSAPAALLGGAVEENAAKNLRLEAGDGKTGGVFVEGKGSFEVDGAWMSLSGDCMGIGGPATGAAVRDGGELTVKNAVIDVSGLTHYATVAERGSKLHVYDSVLISHGAPFANGEPQPTAPMQTPPPPLMIAGNSRTHCTMTNSESYFHRSTIVADGWGALSTEVAEGYALVEANDCTVITVRRGYATYVDPGCHVRLNRCKVQSADMAAIVGGEGELRIVDSDVSCNANFVLMHSVFGEPDEVSEVLVRDSKIRSKNECFLIKSVNTNLLLENVDMAAENGVLIRTLHNEDMLATPVGENPCGMAVTMKNMTAKGDIFHGDDQRGLWLTLENTALTGVIQGANLTMGEKARWFAPADSEVTLLGQAEPERFDAPAGVTITLHAGETGVFPLASGGKLELVE